MDGEPWHPTQARQRIRTILNAGTVRFSGHALEEMTKDHLTAVDCTNVLRGDVAVPCPRGPHLRGGGVPIRDAARPDHSVEDTAMTCLVCGAEMQTQRENFRYDACGVPGLTLMGVEVSRCPQCGEYEVAIPQIEDLHHTIAQALVRKTSPLTAAEIRYLRTSLGWSGADFARHMGTTAETVSRWETGAASMGPVADRLLRLIVATREPVSDSSLAWLTTITKAKPPHAVRLELTRDDEGWHAEAADLAAV